MLYRGVWKHYTKFVIVRRDARNIDLGWREDDRPGCGRKQRFCFSRKLHQRARSFDVSHHDREWLFFAILPLAHCQDCGCVERVAREVIPTQSLNSENPAGVQHSNCRRDSSLSSGDRVTSLTQVISWSATGAGHRLRMKAPIRRIVVLGAAVTIERPVLHGRVRTIVGKSQDHAVAWTAIRAIDVGVKVTMVLFVKQFR